MKHSTYRARPKGSKKNTEKKNIEPPKEFKGWINEKFRIGWVETKAFVGKEVKPKKG